MHRDRLVAATLTTIVLALGNARCASAQASILGSNLVANPGAESGSAASAVSSLVSSIPGWTRSGNANVLPYDLTDYLQLSEPSPPSHGFNYFAANGGTATLVQDVDISAAASDINAGKVKYGVSAYLGKAFRGGNNTASILFTFKNASGQNLASVELDPPTLAAAVRALYRREEIGIVPASSVRVTVTLTLVKAGVLWGAADNISLVLNTAGTGSVLNTELVVNGNAEAGGGVARPDVAQDIPGWSRWTASVTPYGGSGWITTSSTGPQDRGVNLFCGGGEIYQDIDVSNAAKLVDAAQVRYTVSAWLGGLGSNTSPALTYLFFDWTGKQLAATSPLDAARHTGGGLAPLSNTGALPPGTRRVRISIAFPSNGFAADNISFILISPTALPSISTGGVISASSFGGFASFAPGSWIEIYGSNLAYQTRSWTGVDIVGGKAPVALDGVSVSIGGIPAFLDYTSPGQVVALVPSNAPTGASIPISITNANGTSDAYMASINPVQPGLLAPGAFRIAGNQYVAALFPDGQTFVLPQGAIPGVPSRPARPGETITLYGVGFGPVDGGFAAGTLVGGPNSLITPLQFYFGTTPAAGPSYQGLAPAAFGLYQFNVTVPDLPAGDTVPLSFDLGGAKGSQNLVIAIQN